jgi:RimJ/RimL family protein N-acetyltransferase
MSFTPVALAGRHVRLEPLHEEHAPALLAAADEGRATYALTFVAADLEGMRAYILGTLAEQERRSALPFVVKDANGVVVGTTRFMSIEWWKWPGGPPEPIPNGPDAVEIGGTWYAERVQRTALNTEAKLLLCAHAFEHWRVRRVMWKTDARNARSRTAILRLGARFDGVLRAWQPAADGGVRDTAFYSMLASEWPEAKANLTRALRRNARGHGRSSSQP